MCALYHKRKRPGKQLTSGLGSRCRRKLRKGQSTFTPSIELIEMYVGIAHLELYLPENHSLKGKRRVVRSMCDRLRHRFRISVAETGGQDTWQIAEIGLAAVSGDAATARSVIESAVEYAESHLWDVQIIDSDVDVLDLR